MIRPKITVERDTGYDAFVVRAFSPTEIKYLLHATRRRDTATEAFAKEYVYRAWVSAAYQDFFDVLVSWKWEIKAANPTAWAELQQLMDDVLTYREEDRDAVEEETEREVDVQ